MGPRTGVDAVGGGHERFFEVPKFFFDRPFWIARFGAPVLDRPFWTARFGSDARFGPPVLDSPSIGPIQPPQLGTAPQLLSSSWLLMAPRILMVAPFLVYFHRLQKSFSGTLLLCQLPRDQTIVYL